MYVRKPHSIRAPNKRPQPEKTSSASGRFREGWLAAGATSAWEREEDGGGSNGGEGNGIGVAGKSGSVAMQEPHGGAAALHDEASRGASVDALGASAPPRGSDPEALCRASKHPGPPIDYRRQTGFARCRSTYEANELCSLIESPPRGGRSHSVHGPWLGRFPRTAPRSGCRQGRRAACVGIGRARFSAQAEQRDLGLLDVDWSR